MRYRLFLYLAIATSVLTSHASAADMKTVLPTKYLTWVGTISAGPTWARGGETQTFYLTPEIQKTYVANNSSHAFATGELFVGIQKSLPSELLGQFGLAVATTGNASLQGIIWDDADPEFNNHSYQYEVRNTRVAVKGKLLLDRDYWAVPWISASLGIGFNKAYNFSNSPLIYEALPNPNFSNNTQTAFTYTLGIGAQKAIDSHWQVGVGYEFADWGQSQLGKAAGQTMHSGLALNHLYTSELLLNLTYVA